MLTRAKTVHQPIDGSSTPSQHGLDSIYSLIGAEGKVVDHLEEFEQCLCFYPVV